MMKNRLLWKFPAAALILSCIMAVSCTEDIVVKNYDESTYSNLDCLTGYLRDVASGDRETSVELLSDSWSTSVVFGLTRTAGQGVDVTLEYDAGYAERYNSANMTSYTAWPASAVTVGYGETVVMAPDDKRSYDVPVTIRYDESMEDDGTYIVPVKATFESEDGEYSAHCVYIVENHRYLSEGGKSGDMNAVIFFEVNDTNPLNALELVLDDGQGTMFADYVVLFAANINYNQDLGKVYVYTNPQVTTLLENRKTYIEPLRSRGIKVLLGMLGNHDQSGFAQLSDVAAASFAEELAALCNSYELDGVIFDDEYSLDPDLSNPLFVTPSAEAAGRLCYEVKKAMPDKVVAIFDVGMMHCNTPIDGVEPGLFVDFLVSNYSVGMPGELLGMSRKQCGCSIELNLQPAAGTSAEASRVKREGYGYYMMFAPFAGNAAGTDKVFEQHASMSRISQGLFNTPLKPLEYFYEYGSAEKTRVYETTEND